MKRPAVFFDRDNTLILNSGYLGDPAGVKLAPHAAQSVAKARELGYLVVVVSNQSGVARGLFDETAVKAVDFHMDELLNQADPRAVIDLHEYCPFHPEAPVERYRIDSDRRKPKPGMLLDAAKKLNIDLAKSWLIGDAPRDIEAAKAAGCKAILISWPNFPASPEAGKPSAVKPDATVESLADALKLIAQFK
jgi:D-glycero-D-manno-heptose 1,7-bisphosphate phosphatase